MASGTVKWFSPMIGFGYIRQHDGGRDLLVMGASVWDAGLSTLDCGQQLTYDIEGKNTRRQSAVNLQVQYGAAMAMA